jgi:uracil-DNA glycosylase
MGAAAAGVAKVPGIGTAPGITAAHLPALFADLPPAWRAVLPGWTADLQAELAARIEAVSGSRPIGPPDPFRAMRMLSPSAVKVVLFGQDPYPGAGHADGLAFSAPRSSQPSLRSVFRVLEADRPGWVRPASGRLDAWAAQGALLLNTALTVEIGRKESHLNVGWQALTSQIVQTLCARGRAPVFMLWGNKAQAFFDDALPAALRPEGLCVLRTRHPSNDFAREFMGTGSHFSAMAGVVDWWALPGASQGGAVL